ncbi:flagellar assembly protein FliH [Bacillus sp. JCM 19041]|uniref:flagellar assembly protein FliH n=1 Tax=Bacillus sp. JCM 19041 TaxID=1460637 RepID=UPI0009EC7197
MKSRWIIRQAEAHAQRVEQECQLQTQLMEKEWEKARLAAEREGYDAGFSAGETQAQAVYEDLINHAQSIVETAQADVVRSLEQSEPLMIELAAELAKRILGTILDEDVRMKQFITEILYEVKEYALVKVYVHPKWYDKLHQHTLELQQQMVGCRDFQIVPDVKMEETDCIVLTNAGKLHASLDTQLNELKKQLLQFTGKTYVEATY